MTAEFDYSTMTPENVLKAANLAAEAVRFMNHATFSPVTTPLRDPADVDTILGHLYTLAERLPPLLDQLGAWEAAECAAGRVRVAIPGAHSPSAETAAVAALCVHLGEAAGVIEVFRRAVHNARQITATLAAAPEPREGE